MASFFEQALLRFKAQLQVQSDKQVAEQLGMSPTAFNDRKKRDAFPADKIWALATKRPDLNLDVVYILTGKPMEIREDTRPPLDPARSKPYSGPKNIYPNRQAAQERLLRDWQACNPNDQSMICDMAARLAAPKPELAASNLRPLNTLMDSAPKRSTKAPPGRELLSAVPSDPQPMAGNNQVANAPNAIQVRGSGNKVVSRPKK